jgi:hypothetical protein
MISKKMINPAFFATVTITHDYAPGAGATINYNHGV